MADYPPPVDRLLALGDPRNEKEWPDYLALGLGPEHVPELIRMVGDAGLNEAPSESPLVWAPIHAWRTLGRLRAEAAIGPLLDVLAEADESDNDWALEELPEVFGMIGPAAIPDLVELLAAPAEDLYARVAAARSLREIADRHPPAREECVAILTRQLDAAEREDPALNGFLISDLIDLRAVEAAPAIERAFAGGWVDEMIVGDWEDVRYELGLGPEPERRFPARRAPLPFASLPALETDPAAAARKRSHAKAQRKQQKKSRKQNRRRR